MKYSHWFTSRNLLLNPASAIGLIMNFIRGHMGQNSYWGRGPLEPPLILSLDLKTVCEGFLEVKNHEKRVTMASA